MFNFNMFIDENTTYFGLKSEVLSLGSREVYLVYLGFLGYLMDGSPGYKKWLSGCQVSFLR